MMRDLTPSLLPEPTGGDFIDSSIGSCMVDNKNDNDMVATMAREWTHAYWCRVFAVYRCLKSEATHPRKPT